MIRKFKVELEIVVSNKGNLIADASKNVPFTLLKEYWKEKSIERAIKIALENASDYIDVQKIAIGVISND